MTAVIEQLRIEGVDIIEENIRYLWPMRYDHINVHGKFLFNVDVEMNRQGLRELRRNEKES